MNTGSVVYWLAPGYIYNVQVDFQIMTVLHTLCPFTHNELLYIDQDDHPIE